MKEDSLSKTAFFIAMMLGGCLYHAVRLIVFGGSIDAAGRALLDSAFWIGVTLMCCHYGLFTTIKEQSCETE